MNDICMSTHADKMSQLHFHHFHHIMVFVSLAAPHAVIMTTSSATNGDSVSIMPTLVFGVFVEKLVIHQTTTCPNPCQKKARTGPAHDRICHYQSYWPAMACSMDILVFCHRHVYASRNWDDTTSLHIGLSMVHTRAILPDGLKDIPSLVVLSEVKIKMKMEKLEA